MSDVSSADWEGPDRRERLGRAIGTSLRELRNQLSSLNHQVGVHLDLKDVDLDCLDVIARTGPLSPSTLARRTGLHPATMTGILDRLERGGWVGRERDPSDRRVVVVRVLPARIGELLGLFGPMNASIDEICAGYGDTELELVADFLRRVTDAGRRATEDLTGD
jgi:DNA-binding MarR family transcriptional regulator